MKRYQIKKENALILKGLSGLHSVSLSHCTEISVHAPANDFSFSTNLTHLPKSCENELVYAFLELMQRGQATSEWIKILREYLLLAEKKDKNNEIKSDIKKAIKQIFLGLLFIVMAVSGLGLMVLLTSMSVTGLSLLLIPIFAAAVWGSMTVLIAVLKCGIKFFSLCFRQKNIEQLPMLEKELCDICFQSSSPPNYNEVMSSSHIPLSSAPALDTEPPTYQQAVKDGSALSTSTLTSPESIPELASLTYHTPHLFQLSRSVSSNSVVMDNSPSL